MIAKILYQAGSRLRNPSLARWYRFLKKSEKWSREQLLDHQLQLLRELLHWTAESSPFYQKHFSKVGFDPKAIKSLDDLRHCPIITKQDLLKHNKEIHSTRDYGKYFIAETSGSTGQALVFQRDESWDSFNRANVRRGLSWYGVTPWDRNGYLWGYNTDKSAHQKIKLQDVIQNRFRTFTYDRDSLRAFLQQLKKANYLGGYSSMIYEIARLGIEEGLLDAPLELKLVKGTSEKIFPHYHSISEQAFGRKISSEYGAAESGIIAFECLAGNMHIQSEGVIVEEYQGEILVTNLLARSFPIIRYQLGDFIELAPLDEICPCGMAHPLLRSITGRVGKTVYGKTKTYPSLTFYYVAKNIFFQHGIGINYQFVQNEKGKLTMRLEGQVNKELRTLIHTEMCKYFGTDIDYEINDEQYIHNGDGKARDFVSTL